MDQPQDESPILDALERFAAFVDEVHNDPKPVVHQWEGNADQLAVRSVGRVLCKWRHASRPDRPPHALIVRLAKTLPPLLKAVCSRPKQLLSRRRSLQPLSRVRELDSTCVRWITRQPGISLVEKAGHRRAVLAIERFESLNTLENRVVLSLLRHCRALARDYLRQHRDRFPRHERVRNTALLLRLCNRLLQDPQLAEVSPLKGVPKPNYVLLHDDRYHTVWGAYLEVARQQRRRHMLWMHRERVFQDMATIGLLHSVSRHCSSPQFRKAAHRYDLGLRQIPREGRFVDWKLPPPLWQLDTDTTAFVGPSVFAASLGARTEPVDDDQLMLFFRRNGKTRIKTFRFPMSSPVVNSTPEGSASQLKLEVFTYMADRRGTCETSDFPVSLVDCPNAFEEIVTAWCT